MGGLGVVAAAEHLAVPVDPCQGLAVGQRHVEPHGARAVFQPAIEHRSSPSHPSPVAADSATVWVLRCAWFKRLSRSAGSSRSILFSTSISPSSTSCRSRPEIAEHGQHVVALRRAVGVMRVAHMHDDVGLGDLFQRGAEGRDEMGRQVGDEAHRVGQDRLRPDGRSSRRIVGSRVANSMSSAPTADRVRRLNRVDLPALV